MLCSEKELYEVYRGDKLFRSFVAQNAAMHYLAAARELIPDETWSLVIRVVSKAEARVIKRGNKNECV